MGLENAIIFEAKKGRKVNSGREDMIIFSTTKSKANYCSIKFYIGVNIARKIKINEQSRIKLACDKDDKTIWYLLAGDTGYSIRKEKHGESYSTIINFPFNFIDRKMQIINKNNIEVNSDQRIITIFVYDIFENAELVLK